MAKGYLVLQVTTTDKERYKQYLEGVRGLFKAHGGRAVIGMGSRRRPIEGEWNPERFFLIEFESYEAAESFYFSKTYQSVVHHRLAASISQAFLAEEQPE